MFRIIIVVLVVVLVSPVSAQENIDYPCKRELAEYLRALGSLADPGAFDGGQLDVTLDAYLDCTREAVFPDTFKNK